jgi:hypothetical protein
MMNTASAEKGMRRRGGLNIDGSNRQRISRDSWLAIGLIILLLIVTIAAGAQQIIPQNIPPLASYSIRSDGGRAFREWLAAIGYTPLDSSGRSFDIPLHTKLLLILEPRLIITEQEWALIDKWVEAGGTLIIAGEETPTRYAVQHFGFNMLYLIEPAKAVTIQTPWLVAPPIQRQMQVNSNAYLISTQEDHVTHLAIDDKAVLVSLRRGKGWVIISATAYPFSNAGLKEPGNPVLVLNLLALAPGPGSVWFDEWHHGVQSPQQQVVGPVEWLRYTPGGQAILFAVAVILLGLLLQGQSFGQPVRPGQNHRRRGAMEYITALANLSRRAGHRRAVLEQLYHQLKRNLGRRYRIDPTLPDKEYIVLLAKVRPNLDARALWRLFQELKKSHVSEKEMIQLARQASSWISASKDAPAISQETRS